MLRDALVDERIVRGDQVEQAAVLAHEAVEEQLGLAPQRLGQALVGTADTAGSRG